MTTIIWILSKFTITIGHTYNYKYLQLSNLQLPLVIEWFSNLGAPQNYQGSFYKSQCPGHTLDQLSENLWEWDPVISIFKSVLARFQGQLWEPMVYNLLRSWSASQKYWYHLGARQNPWAPFQT